MKLGYWAILLMVLGLAFWWISSRQRKRSGIPEGELLYSDSEYWQKLPKPLFDPQLALVGKPDYVVRQADRSLIPVELKSSRAPAQPWDSHLMQLAAYCYLVEKTFGKRPSHGIIQYKDRAFDVPYTEELEAGLLSLISQMRQVEWEACSPSGASPNRSHHSPARCKSCGYAGICEQKL